ncbi:MAG: nitroreductase family protein [Thermoleophilia bacterium]|nr:nitroreductase family protein [Thermoleophilia bacterium]
MDVFDAIRGRRSHRAFEQKSVEPEKVDLILEAAQWAPSPANSQPWEFIVITGKAPRSRIASISEEAGRTGSIEIHGYSYVRPAPYASDDTSADELSHETSRYSLAFLESVPVMIAVVGNPDTVVQQSSARKSREGYKYACAAAIQNMLLAAQAQGLGSLWFTYFDAGALSRFLNVPEDKHLIALVCVGYPGSTPQSPGRSSLKQKVRRMD